MCESSVSVSSIPSISSAESESTKSSSSSQSNSSNSMDSNFSSSISCRTKGDDGVKTVCEEMEDGVSMSDTRMG